MSQFEREERYRVLKIKDVEAALTSNEIELLNRLSYKVAGYRQAWEKDQLECVVVESDWPIYEQVWNMIELMSAGQTPAAHWRENGEPDPFGNRFDCERHELPLGHITDDEMANELFLKNNDINILQSAKDRMRWLSRQLVKAESQIAAYELAPKLIERQQAD